MQTKATFDHLQPQLNGTVHPKIKNTDFSSCSVIYQSRLFWCELPSFGDIGHRDFRVHGALNVAPKKYN